MSEVEAISPRLFDFVDSAIEQLSADSVETRLAPTAPIREFCQNFFAQFFENVLEVEAQPLSDLGAREARLIARSRGRQLSAERRALLRRFSKLCKLDPDLRGGDYGGGLRVYREFHETFVPELLSDISAWATSDNLSAVASRASTSGTSYRQAVEEAYQ